jgi:O-antigen/teichoic acid export membrane protein
MALLAPHIVLVGVNMVVGTVLQTRERQRSWALAAVGAAVLNPLLNFPAISYTQATFGNGAIGASVVTTMTELFMLGAGLFLLPRGIFGWRTVTDGLRCCAAGAVMAAVVVVGRELPLLAVIALGGVVYAVSSVALGAVSLGDLREVMQHLLHRGARPQYELAS